jgi:16S rRNA (uracil1498-N3)-methyltransferase
LIYTFYDDVGAELITLKGELFKYLIKVTRHKTDDILSFRDKKEPDIIYRYKILSIDGRSASLELQSSETYIVAADKKLHIGWCIIDPKSIEKVLPMLNESGVSQITFITCKRTQKNFKLDFKRFDRLLEASSQQCGRSEKMIFSTCKDVEEFLQRYPHTAVFDFGGKYLEKYSDIDTVLIGCEGGFTEQERKLFDTNLLFSFKTPMILRSESAVVAISNKILL